MKPFKRLRTEKFSQEVASQIKESIFDGTYILGDRLPSESEMAGMFGVSNVTVRQAIRVLENSGILFTKQGVDGGIFVAEADTMSVSSYLSDMLKLKRVAQRDLTMARLIFEPDIASLVSRVWRGEDLDEIYLNIQQTRLALSKGDLYSARLFNLTFHRLICALTRNPVIIFTLNSVIDVLEENVLTLKLTKAFVLGEVVDHEVIIEKIKSRLPDESREEMRRHIKGVHEELEAAHTHLKSKTENK
jgi:GntR family transcriptional regulator, transcriptional repressor for pyruvate dehydrogenase complex